MCVVTNTLVAEVKGVRHGIRQGACDASPRQSTGLAAP